MQLRTVRFLPSHPSRNVAHQIRVHLLLVNLGTPAEATPESVREFLQEFLSDPLVVDLPAWFWRPVLKHMVLRSRPERVAEAYRSIWSAEGSPLRVATGRMVEAVRRFAPEALTVSAVYRYGEPSLETAMAQLARESVDRIVVVPLFPQRTEATTGTVFQRVAEAAAHTGLTSRIEMKLIPAADAGYVAALAARWLEAMDDAPAEPEHLVVSFHGIPVRYNTREQRQYTTDCEATTRAFLQAVKWPESKATLAYQSKFGPEPWLKPGTASVINALAGRGIKHVGVITPGFLTEGLETLEEIGIRARHDFKARGGELFTLASAVEDHHALATSLVSLAIESPKVHGQVRGGAVCIA
jgi:ferrochelatase